MTSVPFLDQITDEDLFAEIRRRGFKIVPKRSVLEGKWVEVDKPSVDKDFDRWMALSDEIAHWAQTVPAGSTFGVLMCIRQLYDLLQPPSVREARSAQAE